MRRAILMCAGEYEPIPIPVGEEHKSLRYAEAFDHSAPKDDLVINAPENAPAAAAAENTLAIAAAENRFAIAAPEDTPAAASLKDVLVVAVDGGLPRLLAQEIEPDLVLGDFDSLDKKFRPLLDQFGAAYPERLLHLPCEKDDTDTVYAARMCLERGCTELLLYGALGGRLDHTFANLQTLAWLKKHGADGYLIGKTTMAAALCEETVFLPQDYEGTFSLFALDGQVTGVTLEGMKYPLNDAVMTNSFPIGVSNEVNRQTVRGTGCGRASVTIRRGMALMILEKSESEVIRQAGKKQEESGVTQKDGQNTVAEADVSAQGMPDPSLFSRIPLN